MKSLCSTFVSIVLALGVLCAGTENVAAHPGAQPPSLQRSGAALRFTSRLIRVANRRLRYTVKAKYPQAIGADARITKLNAALRDLAMQKVNDFKKDFQAPEERMGPGSTFESDYSVSYSADGLVSIIFFIHAYYEGAAHGMDEFVAFNYDLNSGRPLKLADLFKPGSNYLDVISDYCIKAIKEEQGESADNDWIQEGAKATAENYRTWNITPKGLEILFQRYQVAPYVTPPPDITIPYSALSRVINPAGPLARVAPR